MTTLEQPHKRARMSAPIAHVTTLTLPTQWKVCSLAVDKDGTMFIGTESAFYSMSPAGRLALIAGSEHEKGYRDGQGSEARFNIPRDLAVDRDGSLLVADTYNNRLRRVSAMGTVSTIAGSGEAGRFDGIGPAARFNRPRGISLDVHGTIYISDHLNHCIRKVTPANGMVSTLCGSLQSEEGFVDAVGADARFHFPTGISLDTDANLIVADYGNHCIRKVSTCNGRVITVAGSRAGGDAAKGFADGDSSQARFHHPSAVAVDGDNNILVTDRKNHRLRMIAGDAATVTTLAGTQEGNADGEGLRARFDEPWAVAVDERGRLLVAELGNLGRVRVVEATPALAPTLELVPRVAAPPHVLDTLKPDLSLMLEEPWLSDVAFAVEGEEFLGHRCVLAARSPYFKALFQSGRGMQEEESRAAGKHIVFEGVSGRAFRALLLFLYSHELPSSQASGAGEVCVCELASVADRFQAAGLYQHCFNCYRGSLQVGSVIELVVKAHDKGLTDFEEAAVLFFKQNVIAFQREAMGTLSILRQRPDLIELTVDLMSLFACALTSTSHSMLASESSSSNH